MAQPRRELEKAKRDIKPNSVVSNRKSPPTPKKKPKRTVLDFKKGITSSAIKKLSEKK